MPRRLLFVCGGVAVILVGALVQTQTQSRPKPGSGLTPEWPAPSIIDYRPKSTLVTSEHPVHRAKFPVVDIHSHHPTPISPEQYAKVVAAMDDLNLQLLVNLSGGSGDRLRQGLAAIKNSASPDRMVLFANVNFDGAGPGFGARAAAQLREDFAAGAVGLKVFKDLGLRSRKADGTRLKLDDPELGPIWEECARQNRPVLIHTAEPAPFFDPIDYTNERWLELALYRNRRYPPDRFPRFEELIAERDRMFAAHPKTMFIAAHLAYHGSDLGRLAKLMDRLPNVYAETGAVLAELGRQPRAAAAFLTKYQDRVLFGKDNFQPDEYPYFWRTFETADEYFDYYREYHAHWKLYGLALPDAVLKKLYAENARRLVRGLPPPRGSAGTVGAGPVSAGPVSAGPVSAGPVSAGAR